MGPGASGGELLLDFMSSFIKQQHKVSPSTFFTTPGMADSPFSHNLIEQIFKLRRLETFESRNQIESDEALPFWS